MAYDPAARAAERKQDRSDTYDPAARYTEGYQDPNDPRLYPDVGLRAAWLLGALFVPIYRGGNRVMEPKPLPIIDGNRSHDRPIRTSTALKRVKKPPGGEPSGRLKLKL